MLQCLMVKVKKIQKKVQIVNLLLVTKLNLITITYTCVVIHLHSIREPELELLVIKTSNGHISTTKLPLC